MKIIIAPNAFKEAITAANAARAIERGLRRALPGAELIRLPVADGGDGTADVLRAACGGRVSRHGIEGPCGKPVRAPLAWLDGQAERTCIVEVATTAGLAMIERRERNPMRTTTFGLGQAIGIARRKGARRILVGLGGSATVDGGLGMAEALGFGLLDRRGKPIPRGGRGLEKLARIVPAEEWTGRSAAGGKRAGRKGAEPPPAILAICDVNNRLLGPEGAAPVFGPQKGATPAMVKRLASGLENLAERIMADLGADLGRKVRSLRGGGAAGGLGAGLVGFLGAKIEPGAQFVLDLAGFEKALGGADWVVTGEGALDAQTLGDKAPAVVAREAARRGVPTIALAGSVDPRLSSVSRLRKRSPFRAALSIVPGPMALDEAIADTENLLTAAAYQAGRMMLRSKPSRRSA